MKPILMRHVEARDESFKAWKNGDPYIHNPWHYHPEYEIAYIHRGKGTLFVGDNMVDYNQNDIMLLGPNLPHEWRSEIANGPDLYSEGISAHFKHEFIGEVFYSLPEMVQLNELLEKSKKGIRITDNFTKSYIKEKILMLPETRGLKRIVKLLQILEKISISPGLESLSSSSFVYSNEFKHDERINKVYEYVMKNFKSNISVTDAAQLVNMTNSSFCRFFKTRANKTFIKYLNEVRIGFACKLLLENQSSINAIAYESGYDNISYFNEQFKKIKKMNPTTFVKKFKSKNQ